MDESMPHTLRNVFQERLTYIKLYEAHLRAAENKGKRRDIIHFEMDLETNLMNLYRNIKNKTYQRGKYHVFTVREPKVRVIQSLPYVDRIVHQWYVEEFILPFFVPKFIQDSYACIKNRGTHKAVEKLQIYMRKMKRIHGTYYILKCDIKKYFYTIHKDTLFAILKRNISDRDLLDFTKVLVYDGEGEVGIPIGNYTSQYFANIYLNELDHYIKEKLHIKFYVRYMDDFILLVETKEEAKEKKRQIEKYLRENLKLELNHKSNYYPSALGVDFCGYRIYETHRLLRKRSKQKIKRLIKEANITYLQGKEDSKEIQLRYNSWKAHAKHANSYHLIEKYSDKFLNPNILK